MRVVLGIAAGVLLAACSPAKKDEAAKPPAAAETTPETSGPTGQPVPADVSGAEKLVRDLNAREAVPGAGPDNDVFFARDLSAALKADGADGEIGEIAYDYRWNAQDFEITEVSYAALPVNTDRALVTVSFKNFGEPGQTFYDLCKRPDASWKILDVRSNDKPDGSVRAHLGLGRSEAATQC